MRNAAVIMAQKIKIKPSANNCFFNASLVSPKVLLVVHKFAEIAISGNCFEMDFKLPSKCNYNLLISCAISD